MLSLFSNIIENAINYESRLLDENKRGINLQIAVRNGFLRIEEENPMGEVRPKSAEEQDTRFHGLGLLSMKRIVKTYHGVLSTKEEDGYFKLTITIPYLEG